MGLYQILEDVKHSSTLDLLTHPQKTLIKKNVSKIIDFPFTDDLKCSRNLAHLEKHQGEIAEVLETLHPVLGLDTIREKTDGLIAYQLNNSWSDPFKQNLITSYLGFAFWDVITFSIVGTKSVGEFDEILVNRISPNDDLCLKSDPLEMPLKGTAMRSFGAFFSREDRENDYLWGRLNGAERLIDFLYRQAQAEGLEDRVDIISVKKRAFSAILEAEKKHLQDVPDLFSKIEKRIDQL